MSKTVSGKTRKDKRRRMSGGMLKKAGKVCAAFLVFAVTYALILPAFTLEAEVAACGLEEHTHTEECYEAVLVCTDETEGHEHGDECYESVLTCTLDEHQHTDECYAADDEDEAEDEAVEETAAEASVSENTDESTEAELSVTEKESSGDAEYTGEAEGVKVTASAAEGVLPEDAELLVSLIDDEEEIADAEAVLAEGEVEYDGLALLDISFVDSTGNEVEPEGGSVKVKIELEEGFLPEDADTDTLSVRHLDESDGSINAEVVADAAGEAAGLVETEDGLTTAEFEVESFSSFTITWSISGGQTSGSFTVNVSYIDDSGDAISGTQESGVTITVGQSGSSEVTFEDYAGDIAGYEYAAAYYTGTTNSYQGTSASVVTSASVSTSGSGTNVSYSLVFLNGESTVATVDLSTNEGPGGNSSSTLYVWLVYSELPTVSVSAVDTDGNSINGASSTLLFTSTGETLLLSDLAEDIDGYVFWYAYLASDDDNSSDEASVVYLKVTTGDDGEYTVQYSSDGTTWTNLGNSALTLVYMAVTDLDSSSSYTVTVHYTDGAGNALANSTTESLTKNITALESFVTNNTYQNTEDGITYTYTFYEVRIGSADGITAVYLYVSDGTIYYVTADGSQYALGDSEIYVVYYITAMSSGSSSTTAELDPAAYKGEGVVFWDTFTSSTSDGATTYSADSSSRTLISSVVFNASDSSDNENSDSSGTSVGWADSDGTSWSSSLSSAALLSSVYPDEVDGMSSGNTASLTVTPVSGYYVTEIVIACAPYSNSTYINPYGCKTWENDLAFSESFSVSASGAVTIDLENYWFAHNGYLQGDATPVYFILIRVAPIPSPLYVEYDYGIIANVLGDVYEDSVFAAASGWTAVSGANIYAPDDTSYNNGDYGVLTNATQMKYVYDDDESGSSWVHYTNQITCEAAEAAAEVGYYFAGWSYTYYTTAEATKSTGDSSYNNYDIEFSNEYGSGEIAADTKLTLTTNVKLTAIWIPVTIQIEKIVTGLDGYSGNALTYTLQACGGDCSFGDVVTFTFSANGTESDYVMSTLGSTGFDGEGGSLESVRTYAVAVAGMTYSVSETSPEDGSTVTSSDGTKYYLTVTVGDDVSYSVSDLIGTADTESYGSEGSAGTSYPSTDVFTVTYDSNGLVSSICLKNKLTVTNSYTTDVPVSLTILKLDGTDQATALEGAEFVLYSTDSSGKTYYDKSGEVVTSDYTFATDENGTLTFSGLYSGSYTLSEVKAPDGYTLLSSDIYITVSNGSVSVSGGSTQYGTIGYCEESGTWVLPVYNTRGYELPSTGGRGTASLYMTGVALAALALSIGYLGKARRRRA